VNDVVSFAQVEEAVDHAPQPAARGPHDLGAMEQLAAAHEHDALGHEPNPARKLVSSQSFEAEAASGCRRIDPLEA